MTHRLDPDVRWFLVGYAVVVPALLFPLFATPVLPGLDLPFHLAIADMLEKSGATDSPYAEFYTPRLGPSVPALPWLLLALLGKGLGPLVALKLLVGLSIAALPLSVAALARAWGTAATPALLAAPLGYHLGLHYGFFGYTLSLPVVFAVLAIAAHAGVGANAEPRRPWTALLLACASLLLFGLHLESYALAGTAVVVMTVVARGSFRTKAITLGAFVPSAALFLLWHAGPTAHGAGAASRSVLTSLADLMATRRAEQADLPLWRDLVAHVLGLRVHLLRGFRDGSDLAASTWIVATWAALALASRHRELRANPDHPYAKARRATLAVVVLAYLVLPHHWDAYEVMSLSPRLAPVVVAAAIAALPVRSDWFLAEGTPRLLARSVLVAPVFVGTGYAAALSREYARYGTEVADALSVLSRVPPGGRLVGLVSDGESRVMNVESLARSFRASTWRSVRTPEAWWRFATAAWGTSRAPSVRRPYPHRTRGPRRPWTPSAPWPSSTTPWSNDRRRRARTRSSARAETLAERIVGRVQVAAREVGTPRPSRGTCAPSCPPSNATHLG
ncbi:MAG: hypothetical protein U0169_15785 [Polyangiaceae bacterium]